MKDSIQLYGRYLALSVRAQMQYRASFILSALGTFVATGVEILGVWALFDRFGNLGVWSFSQIAVFYGTVNVAFAITDFLSRGFDTFGSRFVRTGDFDRVLLRPRTAVMQIAGSEFPLHRIGRFSQGFLVLVVGLVLVDVEWSLFSVFLLTMALIGTMFFFYAILIFQATLSFWTTESLEVMNTLTYGGIETAQYPLSIYKENFQRFFVYVVPLGCVTYFPIVGALGVDDPLGSSILFQATAPLAGIAFFALALFVWMFGIRNYASTGS